MNDTQNMNPDENELENLIDPAGGEASDTVTISRSTLRQLVMIPEELEKADRAYMNCQSTVFRNYARSLFGANKTRNAVLAAKEALQEE